MPDYEPELGRTCWSFAKRETARREEGFRLDSYDRRRLISSSLSVKQKSLHEQSFPLRKITNEKMSAVHGYFRSAASEINLRIVVGEERPYVRVQYPFWSLPIRIIGV